MRKILFVIISGLLLFAGCSAKVVEKKTLFTQNEVVEYDGLRYTVSNVRKSAGGQWNTPDAGNEYVIVTLKIVNFSDEKKSYNAFDWKMQNSKGIEDSYTFYTNKVYQELSSGELVAGGSFEGFIVFQQPIGDTGLKLNYYPTMLDSKYKFQIEITTVSPPVKSLFAQTEVAAFKGVEYSVTSVKKGAGTSYFKPSAGKEFVFVTVKVVNKGTQKIGYNSYDWKMQNAAGQEDGTAFYSATNFKSFDSGDLLVGGVYTGILVFEETKNDAGLKLSYYSSDYYSDEPSLQFTIK
jgi:hypothetical protein